MSAVSCQHRRSRCVRLRAAQSASGRVHETSGPERREAPTAAARRPPLPWRPPPCAGSVRSIGSVSVHVGWR
eukprot:766709-Rhodomonas_salina.1